MWLGSSLTALEAMRRGSRAHQTATRAVGKLPAAGMREQPRQSLVRVRGSQESPDGALVFSQLAAHFLISPVTHDLSFSVTLQIGIITQDALHRAVQRRY